MADEEARAEPVTDCYRLKLVAPDGKMRLTDVAGHRRTHAGRVMAVCFWRSFLSFL